MRTKSVMPNSIAVFLPVVLVCTSILVTAAQADEAHYESGGRPNFGALANSLRTTADALPSERTDTKNTLLELAKEVARADTLSEGQIEDLQRRVALLRTTLVFEALSGGGQATALGSEIGIGPIEVFSELPPGATEMSTREPGGPGSTSTFATPLLGSAEAPDGDLFGGGGVLAAWGCWKSTCCAEWGRCCLPRYPRGRNCWTCCRRTEECTRCIWPW